MALQTIMSRLRGQSPTDTRLAERRRLAESYLNPIWAKMESWLATSRETTNFTYDLTDLNLTHLAGFVSGVTAAPLRESEAMIAELANDRELAEHVRVQTQNAGPRGELSDLVARYARRAGWYALVRLTKPRLVVETGVEKGLGSVVLCAALRKNAAEGHPGRYLGTDIDTGAGWMLKGPYAEVGKILYGDSIESLKTITDSIDLFINDSDHSSDYERREYETIASKLSERAIILGDNAHVTPEIYNFAKKSGRKFLYFQERPKDHWYPGAGIGAAFGTEGR
ncbi:MAG TPA: class I SAM-dependent methyltransferase [Phycisphaerales bacterium]